MPRIIQSVCRIWCNHRRAIWKAYKRCDRCYYVLFFDRNILRGWDHGHEFSSIESRVEDTLKSVGHHVWAIVSRRQFIPSPKFHQYWEDLRTTSSSLLAVKSFWCVCIQIAEVTRNPKNGKKYLNTGSYLLEDITKHWAFLSSLLRSNTREISAHHSNKVSHNSVISEAIYQMTDS